MIYTYNILLYPLGKNRKDNGVYKRSRRRGKKSVAAKAISAA